MKLRAAVGLLAIASVYCKGAEALLPVAIKDAHIVTGNGEDLAKGTIVLRNGMIEAIGPDVAVPADVSVMDGNGLTVYPGFIDALSTWGIPQPASTAGRPGAGAAPAQTAAAPNPSRVRGPEDRPQTHTAERAADQVSPSDSRLAVARAAGFTSAATFPNQGIFEGQGAVINLAGERSRDMVLAQPIGQLVAFRFGGGGLGRAFPASLMGNISYVRQLYLDLEQYKTAQKLYAQKPVGVRRPEYDRDLEGLADSPRLLLPAVEKQQIDRMIEFGKELKTPYMLYGLHEGFDRVDRLKQANVPLIISLKWPEKAKDSDPEEIPNYRTLLAREKAPQTPGLLAKAGVKFAFSTIGIESATDLKKALKRAVDGGLSRSDAVRALTLTPAEYYGIADRTGSLEKGKIANLVLVRGDLFEEKSLVESVFIDGTEFRPARDLQQPASGEGRNARKPTFSDMEMDGDAQ